MAMLCAFVSLPVALFLLVAVLATSSPFSGVQADTTRRRFENKVVIITGSSSGIGRVAALAFAREGASVVIHGQNKERLDETKAAILAFGIPPERVLQVFGSMEDMATPEKIVDETVKKFGQIDVLVNNAGAESKKGCTDLQSLELLDYLYTVNFKSVVHLSQLALPYLAKTRGNVVNLSSISAIRTSGNSAFYGSMKAALDTWTRARANTFGEFGVRMNCVNPGPINTPIFGRNVADPVKKEELRSMVDSWAEKATILKRMGAPEELASVILFLASDDASFVIGECLVADGGATIRVPEVPWRSKEFTKHHAQ